MRIPPSDLFNETFQLKETSPIFLICYFSFLTSALPDVTNNKSTRRRKLYNRVHTNTNLQTLPSPPLSPSNCPYFANISCPDVDSVELSRFQSPSFRCQINLLCVSSVTVNYHEQLCVRIQYLSQSERHC